MENPNQNTGKTLGTILNLGPPKRNKNVKNPEPNANIKLKRNIHVEIRRIMELKPCTYT